MESHEATRRDRQPITREIVRLHKDHFGRGPVTAKTHRHEDSVLVLMFEGHTPSEATLEQAGQARGVAQTRVDLSEALRQQFIEIVEKHTGRQVIGMMTGSQQEPSLLSARVRPSAQRSSDGRRVGPAYALVCREHGERAVRPRRDTPAGNDCGWRTAQLFTVTLDRNLAGVWSGPSAVSVREDQVRLIARGRRSPSHLRCTSHASATARSRGRRYPLVYAVPREWS